MTGLLFMVNSLWQLGRQEENKTTMMRRRSAWWQPKRRKKKKKISEQFSFRCTKADWGRNGTDVIRQIIGLHIYFTCYVHNYSDCWLSMLLQRNGEGLSFLIAHNYWLFSLLRVLKRWVGERVNVKICWKFVFSFKPKISLRFKFKVLFF